MAGEYTNTDEACRNWIAPHDDDNRYDDPEWIKSQLGTDAQYAQTTKTQERISETENPSGSEALPQEKFKKEIAGLRNRTYYQILGVEPTATLEEIKTAYRNLARKYHPDMNPGDKSAEEMFKQINEANLTLLNPDTKKKYDSNFLNFDKSRKPLSLFSREFSNAFEKGTTEFIKFLNTLEKSERDRLVSELRKSQAHIEFFQKKLMKLTTKDGKNDEDLLKYLQDWDSVNIDLRGLFDTKPLQNILDDMVAKWINEENTVDSVVLKIKNWSNLFGFNIKNCVNSHSCNAEILSKAISKATLTGDEMEQYKAECRQKLGWKY